MNAQLDPIKESIGELARRLDALEKAVRSLSSEQSEDLMDRLRQSEWARLKAEQQLQELAETLMQVTKKHSRIDARMSQVSAALARIERRLVEIDSLRPPGSLLPRCIRRVLRGALRRASVLLGPRAEPSLDDLRRLVEGKGPNAAVRAVTATRLPAHRAAAIMTDLAKAVGFRYGVDVAARLARAAHELDPKPYRRKWLAFKLYELGQIREPARLVETLDGDVLRRPSERHLAVRIKSAANLLDSTIPMPSEKHERRNRGEAVLYVASSVRPFHVSGYTIRTHALVKALGASGLKVHCVARPGYPVDRPDRLCEPDGESYALDGVMYHLLPRQDKNRFPMDVYFEHAADALVQKARDLDAAIIHAASNYEAALPALLAARRLGIPCVYEVRGLWEYTAASKKPGWENTERFELDRRLETFVATAADAVLTLSEALREELAARGVDGAKIHLAPNATEGLSVLDSSRGRHTRAELGIEENAFVVGYIGSIVEYEGLDVLIDALALLREGPRIEALIAGEGDALPMLKERAEQAGVAERVTFCGRIPPETIDDYYGMMDAVVLPRKPYRVCELVPPLKPLEVMARRLPLLVSDVRPLREIVDEGSAGLIHKAGDPRVLASDLRRLATAPDLRQKLADEGAKRLLSKYTWSRVTENILIAYEQAGFDTAPFQRLDRRQG